MCVGRSWVLAADSVGGRGDKKQMKEEKVQMTKKQKKECIAVVWTVVSE